MAHVAESILPGHDRRGTTRGGAELDRHLPDGVNHTTPHVERAKLGRRCGLGGHCGLVCTNAHGRRRPFQGGEVGGGDIANVHEVPALGTVFKYARGLSPLKRRPKQRRDARVRRVLRHPGAVDVVVAQRSDPCAGRPGPRRGEVFLAEFAARVHVARIDGVLLRDQHRRQRRAGRLIDGVKSARVEVGRTARRGPGKPVRALIAALPVDNHRRRQNQTTDARARHRGQKYRGPDLVAVDVVRRIGEVDTKADLRGLMADDVDAIEGRSTGGGIGDVADQQLDPRVDRRWASVHIGAQRVEHPHAVAAFERSGDDGAADETGSAGHEHVRSELVRGEQRGRRAHRVAVPAAGRFSGGNSNSG